MKNFKLFIILILLLSGCTKKVLDKAPQDRYTDAAVWSDVNLARSYLARAYDQIDFGMSRYQMLGSLSDELVLIWGGSSQPYNLGTITPDNLGTNAGNLNWNHFSNIQRINLFLANIDRVPESYDELKKPKVEADVAILKGEALFLRAWEYHKIMFSYGGLPLLKDPSSLGDDFSGIQRSTFKETVDFIAEDCDKSASLLKLKSQMEMGRATKEAALALKSRVLLFAASDLTADGTAESPFVGYQNPDRKALWTAARDAAKVVMDLGTTQLADLGAPNQAAVADKYHQMFEAHDLSNIEVIWGRMFRTDLGTRHRTNQACGPNGNGDFGSSGITGQMVDSYEMMDGSKFSDHFTINNNSEYINISNKFTDPNPYKNREPRFYASVLYDSAVWQQRFSNLIGIDPLGIYDRRTRIVMTNGNIVSQRPGLDTRQGPADPWNGSYSGYLLKKLMDRKTIGRNEFNQNIWIHLRFAEILLNYAEASLELGDMSTAALNINKIRNRSALPNFTGDTKEALRQERKIELFAEDNRWYDIRRWKILLDVLNMTPGGIDITEITKDGNKTTTWKRVNAQEPGRPDKKMYWIPIATDELRRAPQLKQNPGY